MTRALLLALLAAAPLAGCADRAANDPATTTAASEAAAPSDDAIVLRGRVAEVLHGGDALRVDHEAVPDLGMEAMRMDFRLADAALAEGLAPGDLVAMTVEAAPRLQVTALTRLPAGTPLVLADTSVAMADTLGGAVR